MQQINLVDARLLPQRHLLSAARLMGVALAGLVVVGAHLIIEMRLTTQAMFANAATSAPTSDDATPAEPDDTTSQLQTRLTQRQALRDMLAVDAKLPTDSAALLRAVLGAVPDGLWLSEVDIAGANGLRIAGGVLEPAALRGFAERLARITPLRGVPIETLRVDPQAAETTAEGLLPARHSFVLASTTFTGAEAWQ